MPAFSEDLFFPPIAEWSAKLKAKQIPATELARAFGARVQRLGPQYNALALALTERAVKKAKSVDDDLKRDRLRSPLAGIPFGTKDLLSVAVLPTTWGAKPYAAQVFDYPATVLQKLDKAGAVLIGKLSMVRLPVPGRHPLPSAPPFTPPSHP